MVVELKIRKKNPWAGLLKYKHCFDYIAPYFTRSGSIYTGLTPEDERKFEKELGYPEGHLAKIHHSGIHSVLRLALRAQFLMTHSHDRL